MPPLTDHYTRLFELLEQERAALVHGELGTLSDLTDEKEDLISQINANPLNEAEQLGQLQVMLSRNQALLNSALEGIRAVADRMAELRKVRQGLETYDQTGQRNWVGVSLTGKLEKRA